ncbi:hypothetical protein C8R48DRAFT_772775 [Suillus tomentosus]|nr:hypothetical protein C8R48DRAFT_772775 [Suillus tomentosus]
MANVASSPSSFTFSIPHSESTGHSISLSEFHTLIAIDASSYRDHKETVRRTEAIVGALASDVSDITEKVLAHGATLDATYQLAQDSMTSSEHIRTLVHDTRTLIHDMSGAVNRIDGDVSLMKLEFEEMKVTLKEIRDAMTLVLAKLH